MRKLKLLKREATADGVITPDEQAAIDARKAERRARAKKAGIIIGSIFGWLLKMFGINLFPVGAVKNESNIFLNENNNMKSAFTRINGKDFGKGLLLAVLVVVVGGVQNTIADGTLPTVQELSVIGTSAISAAVAYLVKNFFTNSNDQFLKSEK